jgi:Protein of unknown function (DUF1360)
MPTTDEYSPGEPKPLGGYAILILVFQGLVGAIAAAWLRSRRRLPERIPARDVALLSVGTFKLSRLISKDKVTSAVRAPFTRYEGEGGPSEVSEAPRKGSSLREAIGQLLTCPYCVGQWVATILLAAYLWRPRLIRTAASSLAIVTGADFLQQAWAAVDKRA